MNDFDYPPQFSMILDDFRWFSDSKIAVNDFDPALWGVTYRPHEFYIILSLGGFNLAKNTRKIDQFWMFHCRIWAKQGSQLSTTHKFSLTHWETSMASRKHNLYRHIIQKCQISPFSLNCSFLSVYILWYRTDDWKNGWKNGCKAIVMSCLLRSWTSSTDSGGCDRLFFQPTGLSAGAIYEVIVGLCWLWPTSQPESTNICRTSTNIDIILPIVPHKAVAEVSKIGNL